MVADMNLEKLGLIPINRYKGLKFPLINQMDIIIDEFAEKNDARKNLLCHKFYPWV